MDLNTVKMLRKMTDEDLANISLKLLVHYPAIFAELNTEQGVTVMIWDVKRVISKTQLRDLNDATPYGQASMKVSTIKLAREMFSLGLKEAKDLIEELADAGHLPRVYGHNDDWFDADNEYRLNYRHSVKVLS